MAAQGQWIPMQSKGFDGRKSAIKRIYTEVAGDEVPSYRKQSFRQKYICGTKRTLRAFVTVALIILIINVSWLAYAKAKYGIQGGFGTIRQGECEAVKSLNTWLHLAINILSTLLLTGSNAFMAAFSCPSRTEVDKAHRRGRFLHVGSFSLGNLRAIAKRKGFVVLILALSSVPFHLLHHVTCRKRILLDYHDRIFLTGAPFNLTGDWIYWNPVYPDLGTYPDFTATPPNSYSGDDAEFDSSEWMDLTQTMNDYFGNIQSSASSWDRLENKDCIEAYSNVFVSSRRNVVLVSSTQNDTNSILKYGSSDMSTDLDTNWWICSGAGQDGGYLTCNPQDYISNASSWEVWGYPIEYCLSQPTEDICSVEFSETIMFVVVGFNALKVIAMIWVLVRFDAEHILTSVGDAAASFLKSEDQTTAQMCLTNKREMRRFWQSRGMAMPFSRRRQFWGSAVSKKRWALFFFLMILAFLTVAFFGIWGFVHVKERGISLDPASLWNLGFGSINQNAVVFVGGGGTPVTMAILANLPQICLAIIYLMYRGIMTSMFLAADWSAFAFKRQTLMVSSPAGKQRGTWLLGAPLGWGMTLLALQTLLHWFMSQSIFVVEMMVYNKDGSLVAYNPSDSYDFSTFTNCSYSPIAIIFSVIAAGVLMLSAIIFLWRRFPAGSPPVVSTCSAAISAACHIVNRSEEMVYGELRWGVNGGFPNRLGHCSLVPAEAWDSDQAGPLVDGRAYAGLPGKRGDLLYQASKTLPVHNTAMTDFDCVLGGDS